MNDLIGIEAKKQEFLEIYRTNITRDGADEFLQWLLQTDFFDAPASTRFHGSYKGGLLAHSLNVHHELLCLLESSERLGAKIERQHYSDETVAIVSLLHDVCKAQFYKPEFKNQKNYDAEAVAAMKKAFPSEVKRDASGEFFWDKVQQYTIDEEFPIGHGEKSVILIQSKMKLTANEIYAIRAHMGGWDTSVKGGDRFVGQIFEKSELALFLHMADMAASYLLEKE